MIDIKTPFDYGKVINGKLGHVEVNPSVYNGFVINHLFSNTQDSIFYANEVNKFSSAITPQMQFDFYYYGLAKKSRYGKWNKMPNVKHDEDLIGYVMDYFKYNRTRAIETLEMFDKQTIKDIKEDIMLLKCQQQSFDDKE